MKIVNVTQGTDDWLAVRAGIPTASEFDNLISPTWKIRTGEGPESYLFRKVAERCMGFPMQQGGAWATDQGQLLEKEALPWFTWDRDMPIQRVGFVTTDDGSAGCSPDGLIGDEGGIECKCPQPDAHLKYLIHGGVPACYLAQVHGAMYVTSRKWWFFMSYSRQFPPLIVRVERDEKIQALIGEAVAAFNTKLADAYAKMKALAREEDPRPLPPTRQFRPLIF